MSGPSVPGPPSASGPHLLPIMSDTQATFSPMSGFLSQYLPWGDTHILYIGKVKLGRCAQSMYKPVFAQVFYSLYALLSFLNDSCFAYFFILFFF